MECVLMNKNTKVLSLEYDDESINKIVRIYEIFNIEYAPLAIYNAYNKFSDITTQVSKWFRARGIPAWRKDLDKLLERLGLNDSDELLNKAYGLSLSDQYWLKPISSKVKWKDINFFDNYFEGEVFLSASISPRSNVNVTKYTFKSPNNTTDGMLPKGWIIENNKRILVKHTYSAYSQEPLNEWLASRICKRLGFDYCNYDLDIYKGKLVSKCENFLSSDEEIINACDIFNLKDKRTNVTDMDHYISILEDNGINDARINFENMLILDFLTMNEDRHMKNFGVIRNVKTLKWEKMCPIFDTGQAMNYDFSAIDMDFTDGFGKLFSNSNKLFSTYLDLIKDITRIDISLLDGLVEEYKDKILEYKTVIDISDERIDGLVNGLELRIDKLKEAIVG